MRFTRTSLLRLIRITAAVVIAGVIITYAVWRSLNYARGPHITVFEPLNGSSVASSTLVIRGQAQRINNLKLNGMPMFISEDGYFGNIVIIFPGTNRLTLTGYDQFGRETSVPLEIVGANELPLPTPTIEPEVVATSTATTTDSD